MGGDTRFWILFGGIWLAIGSLFLIASAVAIGFVDPAQVNEPKLLWVFFAVGVAAVLGGGFIIVRARTAASFDRRLMQLGTPITATIADIRRSALKINREPRFHVCYRYTDGIGRMHEGQSRALAAEAVAGFKPGDRVNIKIDPQRPEQSLFLGAP